MAKCVMLFHPFPMSRLISISGGFSQKPSAIQQSCAPQPSTLATVVNTSSAINHVRNEYQSQDIFAYGSNALSLDYFDDVSLLEDNEITNS